MEDNKGNAERPKLIEPFVQRSYVSNMEIYAECFGKNPADFNRYKDAPEIAQIMASIGVWKASREMHMTPYGKQRCYIRNAF